MTSHFYLGTLELIWQTEGSISLWGTDQKFYKPVLPVTKQVIAELTEQDDFPCASDDCFSNSALKAWFGDGGEYRLYAAEKGQTPYLMSFRGDGADHITVMAKQPEWDRHKRSFRPWFQVHLEELLLENQALVLHSASIIYRGEAILFTAPSGTGKTTQTDLWHKYLHGVDDLNGDRTLLQQTTDGWKACGFPIYGSTVRCEQTAVPIRAIIVIRQAKTDAVYELAPMEKVKTLYSGLTLFTARPGTFEQALDLLDDLICRVQVLRLDCTMEQSAVNVLHHYLYGEA